nr:isoform 3 of transcription factor sp1 [Quercus suber]
MSSLEHLLFTDPSVWSPFETRKEGICNTIPGLQLPYLDHSPPPDQSCSPGEYPLFDDVLYSVGSGFDELPLAYSDALEFVHDSSSGREDIWQSTSEPVLESSRPGQRRAYPCICGQWFETLEALERHTRSSLHRAYVCPTPNCGKSFYRRDSFARHKSQHTASESFACLQCPKAFKRKDHLEQHMKNIHDLSCNRRTPRELDRADKMTDQKQAVKNLRRACINRFPDDLGAVQRLQKRLRITDDSTSEEVALNVVEVLLGSEDSLCS